MPPLPGSNGMSDASASTACACATATRFGARAGRAACARHTGGRVAAPYSNAAAETGAEADVTPLPLAAPFGVVAGAGVEVGRCDHRPETVVEVAVQAPGRRSTALRYRWPRRSEQLPSSLNRGSTRAPCGHEWLRFGAGQVARGACGSAGDGVR